MERVGWRTRLVALGVLGIVAMPISGAAAYGAQAALADQTCKVAADLTGDALPQQATALIAALRADADDASLCVQQAEDAAQARAAARFDLDYAQQLAELTAKKTDYSETTRRSNWTDVLAKAKSALELDKEAPGAEALVAQAEKALKALGTDEPSQPLGDVAGQEKGWSAFVDDVLAPIGKLALAALAILAAIALLARLLVAVGWVWLTPPIGRGKLAAVGACASVLAGSAPFWLDADTGPRLFVLVLLVAAAVTAWSWVLATRLRLSVVYRDAEGKEAEGSVTQLVSTLRALAGDGPAGLEVARGTDVSVLDDKTVTDLAGGWAAKLVSLTRAFTGVTPWQLVVDPSSGAGDRKVTAAVLSRNGRTVGAISAPAKPWADDGVEVEPASMVAAFVVVELARAYPESFKGLLHARQWQSVGWLYESQRMTGADKRALLIAAVESDPRNLNAQIALQHDLYRGSGVDDELKAYADWMTETATRLADDDDLKKAAGPTILRLRYSATLVTLNRVALAMALPTLASTRAAKLQERRQEARDLAVELFPVMDSQQKSDFGKLASPHVGLVIALALHATRTSTDKDMYAKAKKWKDDPDLGLTGQFNEACFLAFTEQDEKALQVLHGLAITDEWRQRIFGDPMLTLLAKSNVQSVAEGFAELGNAPRGDLVAIKPYEACSDALTASGLTTAAAVAGYAARPLTLAELAGVEPQQAARLGTLAQLVESWQDGMDGYELELAEFLWTNGIASTADLASLGAAALAELKTSWEGFLAGRAVRETTVWL